MSRQKNYYRVNHNIRASEVRVLDDADKQIGVMSLSEALKKAREVDLDLIEIAPKAKPPVCKIVDFKKFLYRENKKKAEVRKKSKKGINLKEVRLTPFMAENDLRFRLKRAEEFLDEKNKVKISVQFKGRQMGKKEFGYKLIEKTLGILGEKAEVDIEPKFSGRRLDMILRPGKVKDGQQTKKEKVKN